MLDDRVFVSLSVNIENPNQETIKGIGAFYSARAFLESTVLDSSSESSRVGRIVEHVNDESHSMSNPWRSVVREPTRLISAGRVTPNDQWIAPNETSNSQVIVTVPRNVDVVQVTVVMFYQPGEYDGRREFRVRVVEVEGRLKYNLMIRKRHDGADVECDAIESEIVRTRCEENLPWADYEFFDATDPVHGKEFKEQEVTYAETVSEVAIPPAEC
ncbi:MAG: hypothetical protein OXJ90_00590 [Spirochaetaceae bacterium]|nr:hypothetical protein [Spirochaetaceae bacterium]